MDYSVLMSVYQKEKPEYLRLSLQSILNQTVPTDDLVLVCDGPLTPALDAVIDTYEKMYETVSAQSPFHIVRLPEHKGLGRALNKGLDHCRHELVARMDTDDIAFPERMEKQLSAFKEHPEVSLLSSALIEFQNDDINDISCIKSLPLTHQEILKYARKRCPFNHPTVMFKKSAVIAASGYQHFKLFEDYYLWLRILQSGAITMNLEEPLLYMRAGQDMYNRRGGIKYLKCVYRFRKYLWKSGFTSFGDFAVSTGGQAVVCLMPDKMRMAFYKKVLRSHPVRELPDEQIEEVKIKGSI